jgi:hypothetical protein
MTNKEISDLADSKLMLAIQILDVALKDALFPERSDRVKIISCLIRTILDVADDPDGVEPLNEN